jgi:release factor glutamine methyltransferase
MPQVPEDWTILSMIKWGTAYFEEKKVPSPRLSIEWLLADVLQMRRLDIYLQFDRPLSEGELSDLRDKIKRRLKHEPLQYIVGYTEFMHAHLRVTPDVLIPRPETERLVESVLERFSAESTCKVLDIGTGSGCIAIALKMARPGWDVYAIDISESALELARENANLNAADLTFQCGDLFQTESFIEKLPGKLDLIVSNPPYIPSEERSDIDHEVRDYEPEIALFTDNLMGIYTSLKHIGEALLKKGGYLLVEIHEDYGNELVKLFEKSKWETTLLRDYNDKNRIICGLYKG